MATITSVATGDFHWNDTAAWSGGTLPGKGDIARIEANFTLINESSGLHYWTGSIGKINVDSTSNFPSTSGSFFTYTDPGAHRVQITYDSTDSTTFYNCRISSSYANAKGHSPTWTAGESGSYVGLVKNNTPVHQTDSIQIYVSSSSEWHVGKIEVRDQGRLTIKDNAHLALDSDSTDAFIEVEDGHVVIIGNVTASLTGSTERNSGLITHDNFNYGSILISGSSDLRSRTFVSESSAVGAGFLSVGDSSNFDKDDYISVYHETIDDFTLNISPDASSPAQYYNYGSSSYDAGSEFTDARHATSSGFPFPRENRIKTKDNNETFQVAATGSGKIFVKKCHPRNGKVIASFTTSRQQFLRNTGNVPNFTGQRTIVRVRSGHNSFKVGERVVTDTGVVATIIAAKDVLIPNKNIDFTTDTDPLSNFIVDQFVGSGSSTTFTTNNHLLTGSFGLTITTGSDAFGTSLSNNNQIDRNIHLKDFKMRDLRVTVSGSQVGGPQGISFDSNRGFGINTHTDPVYRNRPSYINNFMNDSHGPFIGTLSDKVQYGVETGAYNQIDTDPNHPFNNDHRSNAVTLSIDILRDRARYFYNGLEFHESFRNFHAGSIRLCLRGTDTNIRSLVVQEYVQDLLLDTAASIPNGTDIAETGAIVPHTPDQKIVKIAYSIKDIRGYENLIGAYHHIFDYSDTSSIVGKPIPTLFSTNGDKTSNVDSNTNTQSSRLSAMFQISSNFDVFYDPGNNTKFFEINLGQLVTFDAVSITTKHTCPDSSLTATLNDFGIEYSTDGISYSTAKATADDNRKPRGQSGIRLFTFTEVTARFIKVHVNGGGGSNNDITYFGLHHFNSRGSTLELSSTTGLEVGNTIAIINTLPEPGGDLPEINYGNWRTNAIAGSETTDDYVGGFDHNYKITAISGKIITLDRNIESQTVFNGDKVIKLDRSITVKSDNFIPFGAYLSQNNDEISRIEYYNAAFMNMGDNSREAFQFQSYTETSNTEFTNCTFNFMEGDNNSINGGGWIFMNNALINIFQYQDNGNRRNFGSVHHGNVMYLYYFHGRPKAGQNYHLTGNLIYATRYAIINNQSGPDLLFNHGNAQIRNNYFRYHEYFELDTIDIGRAGQIPLMMDYYDNKSSFMGENYYREAARVDKILNTKNKFQYNTAYPFVASQTIEQGSNASTYLGQHRSGHDRGRTFALIKNDPNHLGASRIQSGNNGVIITPKLNTTDQFQIFVINGNKVLNSLVSAEFRVYETQTIRIKINFIYRNPIGTSAVNIRSSVVTKPHITIQVPGGRTLGAAEMVPFSDNYTTLNYEKEFTATPGNYMVTFHQYSFAHNALLYEFKDLGCTINGTKPNQIFIMNNNFESWRALLDSSLVTSDGTIEVGNEPLLDSATRTAVRLRKIRF